MKKILLGCLMANFSISGFSQNANKEFSLTEVRASDDFEYEIYSYNSDLLLKSTQILFEGDIQLRDTLGYDASNNIIKLNNYQLLNGVWTYVSYIDYTYDQNGNRLSRSNYNSYGTPNFTLGGIYNYHYDNNRLTGWELLMGGTDLAEVATLTYNSNGQLILELAQDTWNTGNLENSWKIEYQYNQDGTLKTTSQSFWNGSSWDVAGSELFYYDANKNCITWEHKSGNTVSDKSEYEYNTEYTVDQLVLPVNPEDGNDTQNLVEMKNMVTLRHWYTLNDQGVLEYICDFLYTYDPLGGMGVENPAFLADHIRVYPNPAMDQITILGGNAIIKNIDVVDNAGRVVLKGSNLNNRKTNLDVSALQSGVYYIRLMTSQGSVTQKLVKQ